MYAWDSNKLLVSYSPRHPLYGSNKKRHEFLKLIDRLKVMVGDSSEIILRDQPPIWIRDWYPVQLSHSQVLFRVATDYMDAEEASDVVHHQTLLRSSSPFQLTYLQHQKPIVSSPLILDGGNVVMDDRYVLISCKVYRDNPSFSASELEYELSSIFEGRKLVIIEAEPEDPTGHADGQMQFLANGILGTNDLRVMQPKLWESNMRQLSKLDLLLVTIPYKPLDKTVAGWPVMNGNYINFAATSRDIVLSSYGDRDTENELSRLLRTIDPLRRQIHFLKSRVVDCLGGGLHCMTWNT